MSTFKLFLFVILFYLLSWLITPKLIDVFKIDNLKDPIFKNYQSDELSFLKTFYLMKDGLSYYPSFKLARDNLGGDNKLGGDVFTWRTPTVFYIWSAFAFDGQGILRLFIFLSLTSMLAIYLILKSVLNNYQSLLGSVLIIPYFYDTLRYKTAFLFMEWWGVLFLILGFAAYTYKKNILALFFIFLAISTRELLVIPILFLTITNLFYKKDVKILISSLILFLIIYIFHYLNVSNYNQSADQSFMLFSRFHQYSLVDLQRMLSFSMRGYVFWSLPSHFLVALLGIISIIMNYIFIRDKISFYLLTPAIVGIVLFPLISIFDNDYWGVLFMPFLIFSIPLVFRLNFRKII